MPAYLRKSCAFPYGDPTIRGFAAVGSPGNLTGSIVKQSFTANRAAKPRGNYERHKEHFIGMDKLGLVGIYRDRGAGVDNAHLGDRDAGRIFHAWQDGRCAAADIFPAPRGKEKWRIGMICQSGFMNCH